MLSSGTSPHHNTRLRGRSPAAKDRVRISPPPPTSPLKMDARPLPLLRRRRVLFPLFALALLCFFLFSPTHDLFGLPPALQGLRHISPASISALRFMRPRVDEMHGLLFYAVHQKEGFAHDAPDPTHPLNLSVYADGDPSPDWASRVKHLNSEAPLIVFSKTYCPFSQRAKELILRYDLVPPPKIIEVDLRDDGDFIKAVLTRLTGRNTFPNVILRGKSIGGSDDIAAMHKDGRLRQVFEKAGLQVLADIIDEA
ncbi:thioredoxin-like protein [Lactarius akahatsu]|uniref:Thioredoxin-like protein n=1 Tax=Lactarius akahatsu TaxID=416441 RepID=A0AAD4LJN2_9AGAM|nr:thioredoxin-like protein [Lactarius akahatsu]